MAESSSLKADLFKIKQKELFLFCLIYSWPFEIERATESMNG